MFIGFGLWNSIPATLLLEGSMFAAAVWFYVSTTLPRDRAGRYVLGSFVGFMVVIYIANSFGPPPPNWQAVAWAGLASWVIPFWAAWFDRHRLTEPST
jgi:hypothetical protein